LDDRTPSESVPSSSADANLALGVERYDQGAPAQIIHVEPYLPDCPTIEQLPAVIDETLRA